MSSWTWWDYCIPFYCQHQFVCDHAKHLIPDVFNLLQSTEERPLVWTTTHLRYVHCPYAVCVCLFTCVQEGYIFWWDNQKWMHCNLTLHRSKTNPFVCLSWGVFICVTVPSWYADLSVFSAIKSELKRADCVSLEICIPRADSKIILCWRDVSTGAYLFM